MVKSFNKFLNENIKGGPDGSKYASDIVSLIKNNSSPCDDYMNIGELEYLNPDVDFEVEIRRVESVDFSKDSHFHNLPWEEINYEHYGFAIDANTLTDRADLTLPKIVVTVLLDKNREPKSYEELYYRLVDITSHEVNHTHQIGWNRRPFKVRPSSNVDRNRAKASYEYFLLPDEIESMVKGAYDRSKEQGVRIDKIFDKYLYPFIMSGRMSKSEYLEVLSKWVKHTLENYPDADLSMEDSKIKSIVDKI
jgi:hypothetical protein